MDTKTPLGIADGFSAKRAAEIVGISYRQLDYWAREGLLGPSVAQAEGSGSRRRYSYGDLLELRVVKRLRDAGISLKKIRSVFQYIRHELELEVAAARLVIDGSNVYYVRSDEELINVLAKGQGVLNVLPLLNVKREVDGKIVELFPETAPQSEHARAEDTAADAEQADAADSSDADLRKAVGES